MTHSLQRSERTLFRCFFISTMLVLGNPIATIARFVRRPTILAALCIFSASSLFAQFTNYIITPWYGGTDHYYGNALITSAGAFNNSAALIYNTSTLPGNTGSLYAWDLAPGVTISSNYYDAVGVLSVNHGWTNIINNNSGGTMQGIVIGTGQAFAMGIFAYSDNANTYVINNSGLMDGEVWNNDGTAAGVYAGGNVFATNNVGGTWSASAPYYAAGIYTVGGGAQVIVNNGTIAANATGATQGNNSNQSYAVGINAFSYDPNNLSPITVINNGSITASCTGGATNIARTGSYWNDQNNAVWINNGNMTATATGASGEASGLYFGANYADTTFINTGTVIANDSTGLGFGCAWLENDSTNGNMYFYNSGTMASYTDFATTIANFDTTPPYGNAYATNTGTIVGGWLGFGWPGNLTFYDSGDIFTGLAWLGVGTNNIGYGNANVVISGLPYIQPVLSGGAGSNTVTFNLTGTLQSVNGNAASGTNLSIFHLGTNGSGNIVVSGKTYRWANFTNVFGIITPAVSLSAGPTNLTATVASSSQANLSWNTLAGATSYNIKRATTGCGPYTTIASDVTTTNFTDNTAFISVEYFYVVSTIVNGVETANSPEVTLRHPKLTGTIIGTAGSYGNSGNTITNAFDGSLNAYFDGPTANGCWAGLDFGAGVSNVITQIRYCPRPLYASRMVGGVFQGANQSNFSDAVALFAVTNQPLQGILVSVNVTNTSAFRYVRYLSPNGSYGDVAELQFYNYLPAGTPPQMPTNLIVSSVSSNQISLIWNLSTNAVSYNIKRSMANGGPYTVVASGVVGTNYNDISLTGYTTYYYVVSAVNTSGESANSAQASARTLVAPTSMVVYNVNFAGCSGSAGTNPVYNVPSGVVMIAPPTGGSERWNNYSVAYQWANPSPVTLVAANEANTNTVTLTWGGGSTWTDGPTGWSGYNFSTLTNTVWPGYMGDSGNAAVWFSGLNTNAAYNVYVYFTWDRGANSLTYSLVQGSAAVTNLSLNTSPALIYNSSGTNYVNGTNYVVFSGVIPSASGTIMITNGNYSALQLVKLAAPTLAAISNQVTGVGVTMSITNVAVDSTVPMPVLTFSLPTGPTNASINAASGALTWRPLVSQANTTNAFTVKVTDSGNPNLSATQSFTVTVTNLMKPQIGSVLLNGGQLTLQVNGANGPDYQVQASTNLVNWNPILTTNSPVMPFVWTTSTTNSPAKFFRILTGPPLP